MSSYDQIALATAETPDSIDELAGFLELKLAHPISADRVARIFGAQTELRRRQEDLAIRLANRELTREGYLKGVSDAYRAFLDLQRGELGAREFAIVYGDDPWDIEGVIDPEIFLGAVSAH